MTIKRSSTSTSALTLVEVICLIFVLFVLALVFLPILAPGNPKPRSRAQRIACFAKLRQVRLEFQMWTNDNNQTLSALLAKTHREPAHAAWTTFRILSNVSSPKLVYCPSDRHRSPAEAWDKLSGSNVSYFVGLDANETQPISILAGDRNITGGIMTNRDIMLISSTNKIGWTKELHNPVGNVLFADGSVQTLNKARLRDAIVRQLHSSSNGEVRIAIP